MYFVLHNTLYACAMGKSWANCPYWGMVIDPSKRLYSPIVRIPIVGSMTVSTYTDYIPMYETCPMDPKSSELEGFKAPNYTPNTSFKVHGSIGLAWFVVFCSQNSRKITGYLVPGGKAEELEQSQGAQNFESSPAIQQWMLHRYTLVGWWFVRGLYYQVYGDYHKTHYGNPYYPTNQYLHVFTEDVLFVFFPREIHYDWRICWEYLICGSAISSWRLKHDKEQPAGRQIANKQGIFNDV